MKATLSILALTAMTVDAHPSSFISTKHVVTLSNANMGTIMEKTSLTTTGLATKCVITDTSGTKDGTNYVIGTAYTFTVNTDESSGLGMVTSVGEGTPADTWSQVGTSGRETSKIVSFTPTTAGDMSVHALCGGNGATPLYLATPLTGTIVPATATCADMTCDGNACDDWCAGNPTGAFTMRSKTTAVATADAASCCFNPAECSTIATTEGFCGGQVYDSSKGGSECAGDPCSKTTGSDTAACCKTVPRASCSSIAASTDFCGDGKIYNDDNAVNQCAGDPCSKTTGSDIGECCKTDDKCATTDGSVVPWGAKTLNYEQCACGNNENTKGCSEGSTCDIKAVVPCTCTPR